MNLVEFDRAAFAPDATPQVRRISHNVAVIAVPIGSSAVPANVYVLEAPDQSLTLIDAGTRNWSLHQFEAAMQVLGLSPGQVNQIVVTHHHPDHIGGLGPVQRLTDATMLATASTIDQAPDVWGSAEQVASYFGAVDDYIVQHGGGDELISQTSARAAQAANVVELPTQPMRTIAHGDELDAGGATWQVIHTPGHADGLFVLFDRTSGRLISSDHLLERISPTIGKFPRHSATPLQDYLTSLELLLTLNIEVVLPGHGMPFSRAHERVKQLIEHHQQRVGEMVAAVQSAGVQVSAMDVARIVFAHVFDTAAYDQTNRRFALTETIAHLEYAADAGGFGLTRHEASDGAVAYHAT